MAWQRNVKPQALCYRARTTLNMKQYQQSSCHVARGLLVRGHTRTKQRPQPSTHQIIDCRAQVKRVATQQRTPHIEEITYVDEHSLPVCHKLNSPDACQHSGSKLTFKYDHPDTPKTPEHRINTAESNDALALKARLPTTCRPSEVIWRHAEFSNHAALLHGAHLLAHELTAAGTVGSWLHPTHAADRSLIHHAWTLLLPSPVPSSLLQLRHPCDKLTTSKTTVPSSPNNSALHQAEAVSEGSMRPQTKTSVKKTPGHLEKSSSNSCRASART